jgi:hypothetical protein
VLVTNCRDETGRRNVVAATERTVRFLNPKLTDDALTAELRSGAALALSAEAAELLPFLQQRFASTYLPVYYGPALAGERALRVVFGPPLPPDVDFAVVTAAIQAAGAMSEEETE